MTREEQLKYIQDNCNAFKRALLAKASKIPPNWDSMEIRKCVMDCAKNAWIATWRSITNGIGFKR